MQLHSTNLPRRRRSVPKLTVKTNLKKKKKEQKTYSTRLAEARGAVRLLLTEELRAITGDETAKMWWNAEDFFTHVANEHGVCLEGWPHHIPFANLSGVPGGISTMWDLSARIQRGSLCFTKLTEHEKGALTIENSAPGRYIPRPPRAVRRDYGKQRKPPWLRLSRPPRRICLGPKSAKYIEDSDTYESDVDEIESVGDWEREMAGRDKMSDVESASGFDD